MLFIETKVCMYNVMYEALSLSCPTRTQRSSTFLDVVRTVMSLKSRRVARHHSKHSKLPLMWFNIIIMWLINMVNKL